MEKTLRKWSVSEMVNKQEGKNRESWKLADFLTHHFICIQHNTDTENNFRRYLYDFRVLA